MFLSTSLLAFLVVFMMLQSAFYSGTEAAYFTIGRVSKNRYFQSKKFFDKRVSFFLKNFDNFLVSILLFNLLNNTLAASFGSFLVRRLLENRFTTIDFDGFGFSIAFVLLFTTILLITSEISPKRLAIRFPGIFIFLSILPMTIIYFLTLPITSLLRFISARLIRVLEKRLGKENVGKIDEKELAQFVERGHKSGALKLVESKMLQHLIRYKNDSVGSIMIPRSQMVGLDITSLPSNIQTALKKFPHHTIPVYEKIKDNFIGVVSKKKLYSMDNFQKLTNDNFKKYIIMPKIHSETKNIVDVLSDMYESGDEIALITDEYGGIEGFVTYHDIVNRLLGRIGNNEVEQSGIVQRGGGLYSVHPSTPIAALNDFFKTSISTENANTVAGYILERLQDIPKAGTVIVDGIFEFRVKQATTRAIKRIEVRRILKKEGSWL